MSRELFTLATPSLFGYEIKCLFSYLQLLDPVSFVSCYTQLETKELCIKLPES